MIFYTFVVQDLPVSSQEWSPESHTCVGTDKMRLLCLSSFSPLVFGGYTYHQGYIPAGGDLGTLPPGTTLSAAEESCNEVTDCQGFTFVGPQGGPSNGTVYLKNNPGYLYDPNSTWVSYIKILNPCDIYAAAGSPCVAAHSVVRALFGDYAGPLYQVNRTTDGALFNVTVLNEGGVANASAQDAFCQDASCLISRIFDQTSFGNHL